MQKARAGAGAPIQELRVAARHGPVIPDSAEQIAAADEERRQRGGDALHVCTDGDCPECNPVDKLAELFAKVGISPAKDTNARPVREFVAAAAGGIKRAMRSAVPAHQ